MITRIWHGYTRPQNADAYHRLLTSNIFPGIHRVNGYRGTHLLKREFQGEVGFITMTLGESLDAIREFAGDDYTKAVVPPEAKELLTRYDPQSAHYETVWCP